MDYYANAAAEYAARGWAVFPCVPGGKVPLGTLAPHGVKDATTDAMKIREWWTAEPNANVAIAAGRSGLVIVDCDGTEGIGAFTSWADAQDIPLGDVPCAATPNGGRHYYFAAGLFPAVPLSPRVRVLPGVDIRAGESYVVAPPSTFEEEK